MTTTQRHGKPVGWAGASFRAIAPWLLLLVGGKVVPDSDLVAGGRGVVADPMALADR